MNVLNKTQAALLLSLCLCCSITGCAQPVTEPTVLRAFPPDHVKLPQESASVENGKDSGIDYGNASQGYIMAWYTGGKPAKVQVKKIESANDALNPTWNYDVDTSGAREALPLQGGSGSYRVCVAEQIEGSRYSPLVTKELDVRLKDDLLPFLYANKYVMFSQNSVCVKKARELTQNCTSDIEAVSKIYEYIKSHIQYDTRKAETIDAFYTPNPDETLISGKGICLDYASLACAMLRANLIPAKLITGKVDENVDHAWNSIYLENQGWVDVKLHFDPNTWELIDLTFAAGGLSSDLMAKYIGSGEHYTELKVY